MTQYYLYDGTTKNYVSTNYYTTQPDNSTTVPPTVALQYAKWNAPTTSWIEVAPSPYYTQQTEASQTIAKIESYSGETLMRFDSNKKPYFKNAPSTSNGYDWLMTWNASTGEIGKFNSNLPPKIFVWSLINGYVRDTYTYGITVNLDNLYSGVITIVSANNEFDESTIVTINVVKNTNNFYGVNSWIVTETARTSGQIEYRINDPYNGTYDGNNPLIITIKVENY